MTLQVRLGFVAKLPIKIKNETNFRSRKIIFVLSQNRLYYFCMYPLSVINLKKTYISKPSGASVEAVKGVSFHVCEGEIFGLLGPNGAGKTSLISCITGLEKPTSGDVQIFSQSILSSGPHVKMSIGVVAQEVVSSGFFNLEEILSYMSGYYGIKNNQKKITELLKRLNLWEHKHKMMRQLSGGMKRRMMIAKALVHSPRILLLDEPTAGVDVELRNDLWNFVRELQQEKVSIVLTTHYLQEAEALCDRVGIINKGELKYCASTREVIKNLTQKRVEIKMRDGQNKEFFMNDKDHFYDVLLSQKIAVQDIADVKTFEGSLEDAFIKVLKI